MTIVTKNSLTLSNVNDGTITHTAYAYSADGTDRFTNVYTNLNLLDGTKDFSGNWSNSGNWVNDGTYKGLTVKKRTGQWGGIFKPCAVSTDGIYTFSAYIKSSSTNNDVVRWVNVNNKDTNRDVLAITSNWSIDTFSLTLKAGDIVHVRYEITTQNTTDTLWNAGHKWEEGSVATPYMPSASEVKDNDYPSYRGEYLDYSSTSSTDPSKYSWGLIRGNTSYSHTAYSWSADGKDGFTTVYPNLNLGDNTKTFTGAEGGNNASGSIKIDPATQKTQDGDFNYLTFKPTRDGYDWFRFYLIPDPTMPNMTKVTVKPNTKYTFSVLLKGTGGHSIIAYNAWTNPSNTAYNINLTSDWKLYTFTVTSKDVIPAGNVQFFIRSNNGTEINLKKPKVEEGSTATPYMPSSSEIKTSDYPNYIGTYSDSNVESSLDYSKYQWAIFKGQNSNAYTAYSWSSDGTDRFSTVYPNLNLLNGSSAKTKDGFFKNFDKVENDYGEVTVKGTNTWVSTSLWDGFSIQPRDYKPNDKYTMSMDVMFTSWNLPAGTTLTEFWIGQRYSKSTDGSINSWKHICDIDLPRDPSQMLNQWIRITKTSTIPPYEDPAVNTEALFMTKFTGASEGSFTVRVRKPKQEVGSVTTPYMPSESEAQDQWQDAIPMYVGVGEKDSQNPSDYRWQLNPRYVQASSDSGLSNKAGIDDLASVADTANDALVKAQNAVSNEDYTSWLEHDYQSTINNLQDVSAQNQKDIKNVDDRTTIVEGFYGGMKVKWNFIDESFSFSEEGMFISNAQSKMSIQITSDKIVFWDNNVDVAFITGEVLNIQKGVFLESATIGNHLITKFSDDSPVTIIRYVGGIT